MSPLISIVIVNYNRESYLQEAIASVLAQTWQNFELLIWDNGSTDGSVAIARAYTQQDGRVRVVEADNQGVAAACKAAIAQTSGTYIGILDNDDILAPTALAQTATVLNRHPETGFVYTDYLNIDPNGKVIGYGDRCNIPYSQSGLLVDFMTFHFRLMRRSVYDRVGGVNELFSCCAYDYDLCLRLSEVAQVRRIQEPLYFYRNHSQSISVTRQKEQILWSKRAIAQALWRRGLADKLQIDVELPTSRFILRCKKSLLDLLHKSKIRKNPTPPKLRFVSPPRLRGGVGGGVLGTCTRGLLSNIAASGLVIASLVNPKLAQAQQIVPAADGTNTIVTPNGNRFDITGGTTSRDGANLFHSFQQFGISPEQIANFQASPALQNILGRITGGNASVINGLIQVTGGNANLFLMNPAGFIFGANASLNVPGAFTVTTANGIGFGSSWFNAIGVNDYINLVGNPNGFAFSMNQPGAIANAGNLVVGAGQNLNLFGGTIVNTGQLSAPGGQIAVTSVPGQNWVRLSQPGNLLSLEIQPLASSSTQPNNWTVPIASIPELLTVGNTGLTANPDGTVKLTNSNVTIPITPGTTIVSGTVNAASQTGGTVTALGQKVAVIDANINASGNNGGGTVLIGGDYQGQGTLPNADRTYVDSKSVINADSNLNGNGGRVIIWGNDTTQFFGKISARGGANAGNGGFVEVSGKNFLTFNGLVDTSAVNGNFGTLLLDPSTLTIIDGAAGTGDFDATAGNIAFGDADIGANTVSWGAIAASGANINLQATGNITIDDITGATPLVTTPGVATLNLGAGGSFSLSSQTGSVNFVNPTNTIQTTGGAINISGASLSLGNLDTTTDFSDNSGNVNLSATGDIVAGNIIASGQGYLAGNITVTSSSGGITLNNLDTSNTEGFNTINTAGTVSLSATSNILTGRIDAFSNNADGSGQAGDVVATTTGGSITTEAINSSVVKEGGGDFIGTAGAISLTSRDNITVNDAINASASAIGVDGTGNLTSGNVTLQTTNTSGSNIRFTNINTQAIADDFVDGNTVQGGNVQVLTNGLIQGIGTGEAIATGGFFTGEGGTNVQPSTGGTVSIRHDGGPNNVDFIVGDASVNGTAGSINTGDNSIIANSFPVLPNGGDASGTPIGITITSVNTPPTLTANSSLPDTQTNQPVTLTFSSLAPLVSDVNNDITSIKIDVVNTGNITVNGVPVIPGVTTLSSGDTLVYTPPADTNGSLNAFVISANDGVSSSAPVQIGINVSQTPTPNPETPNPETPNPETPNPETPNPETPNPETPNPETPNPETPNPETPNTNPCTFQCNLPSKPNNPVLNNPQIDNPVLNPDPTPEDNFTDDFADHLGIPSPKIKTLDDAKKIARKIEEATGIKPAFIYISFVPVEILPEGNLGKAQKFTKQLNTVAEKDSDQLEVVVVTGKGDPIRKRIPETTKAKVLQVAQEFRDQIVSPQNRRRTGYLRSSQQLYRWMVAPLEADLQAREINNLVFLPDIGLRSTPMAALHDGKGFLAEKYSIGLMPSLSLTNTLYKDIKKSQILALGVSQSTQGQEPLPAVPLELSTLVSKLWQGKLLLDKQATLKNLKTIRRQQPFGIIHMATHANFATGALNNSYIQLWEDKLRLNQLRQLRLNEPEVEMLVLSACRTALGDKESELGFAGLAVLAGVKTSVASLWSVNDAGTAALMTKFYENLKTTPIKAEALRQAQVAMLKGQIYVKDGQVQGLGGVGNLPLPADSADESLMHPYYWAGFTMVGNPW
ncbi:CHAT domain-containing protein [Nostoc sp. DedQUE07]|uniref:CHAT domain-containing protein n=1 Tax=Nostoc sp. DedQUE07 TaxID=3075392 RepID=UPI002AD3E652|nr:CHAT domain-containing protein [Nostoc sp. DedQUE07]MDZ8130671.1 CHAT domain-containing protein [Nostoc sp. DedQUE07]